jgi:hypothetical protein
MTVSSSRCRPCVAAQSRACRSNPVPVPLPLASAATPITSCAVAPLRRNEPSASSTYPASSPSISATITTEFCDRATLPRWRASASAEVSRSAGPGSMNELSRSRRCFSLSSEAASSGPAVRRLAPGRPGRSVPPASPSDPVASPLTRPSSPARPATRRGIRRQAWRGYGRAGDAGHRAVTERAGQSGPAHGLRRKGRRSPAVGRPARGTRSGDGVE